MLLFKDLHSRQDINVYPTKSMNVTQNKSRTKSHADMTTFIMQNQKLKIKIK